MKNFKLPLPQSLLLVLENLGIDDYEDWAERIIPQIGTWNGDPDYLPTVYNNLVDACVPSKFEDFMETHGDFLKTLCQIEQGYWEMAAKFSIPGLVRTNVFEIVDLFVPMLEQEFAECIDWDRFTPVPTEMPLAA